LFDSKLVSQEQIHPETRYIAYRAMQEARVRPNYIKTWTVPEHVRYIGKSAFIGDTAMNRVQTIEIRGDDLYIAKNAFGMCERVTQLYIGKGVTHITPATFNCLPRLGTITVEEGNPVYTSNNNCLIEKESGTLIRAGSEAIVPTDGSIKHIASGAYFGFYREELPANAIPDGVISIGSYAFYNYSTSQSRAQVNIPHSVTSIGQHVFGSGWDIHYNGTKAEFIKMENNMAYRVTIFCTDGEIQISSD
jgi:hypothetical protein